MQSIFSKKIKKNWLFPELAVCGLVITARTIGILQNLEWFTLDRFLMLRPWEPVDERIAIVGINEKDIQDVGYPIPDREIAALLNRLQSYKPRVIGLDLVRDLPVEPGHTELVSTFKESKNLIAIEKVLPDRFAPPPNLPPEQIGFADVILDADNHVRRSLLGTPTPEGFKFSLSVRLAEAYLLTEGITLENGIRDPIAMRFGSVELPCFFPNFGGYVQTDDGGIQTLVNFRSGSERFRTLSLNQIKTKEFDPDWLKDRIVIVGMSAPSVKDIFYTSALVNKNPAPGLAYGVEIHAHAVSQIVSAVLDGRPLLRVWSDGWEYLWILGWGVLGICLGRLVQFPWKNFLSLGISSIILLGVGFVFLLWGWWIPVIPALLVLLLNGVVLSAFYHYDRALRSQIDIQKATIERTFDQVHNGPLQTLKALMRDVRDRDLPPDQFLAKLDTLDEDLRKLYEFLQQETILSDQSSILVGKGVKLDLKLPLHELLDLVYRYTLQRELPCFKTLKITIPQFDRVDLQHLNMQQKRGLCLFLEEALCNVGKYAIGVTRLKVTLTQQQGWFLLYVEDNGRGICSSSEGQGTKQAINLARQLKGKFQRLPLSGHGIRCELTWPMKKSWF